MARTTKKANGYYVLDKPQKCKLKGCKNKTTKAHGYCMQDYRRAYDSFKLHNNPSKEWNDIQAFMESVELIKAERAKVPVPAPRDKITTIKGKRDDKKGVTCFVPNCSDDNYAYGVCNYHARIYDKNHNKEWKAIKKFSKSIVPVCSKCDKPAKSMGFCKFHYDENQQELDPVGYAQKRRKAAVKYRGIEVDPNEYFLEEPLHNEIKRSIEGGKLVIETNVEYLAKIMEMDNKAWVLMAIRNLAEGKELEYRLNAYNYNIILYFDELVEMRDALAQLSKAPGILEIPGRWRERVRRKRKVPKEDLGFNFPITYHEHDYMDEEDDD